MQMRKPKFLENKTPETTMATAQSEQTKAVNNLATRVGNEMNRNRVNYNLSEFFKYCLENAKPKQS